MADGRCGGRDGGGEKTKKGLTFVWKRHTWRWTGLLIAVRGGWCAAGWHPWLRGLVKLVFFAKKKRKTRLTFWREGAIRASV